MKLKRNAFTLMEVLISIALLSIVLFALHRSVDILRASNKQLFDHLDKAKEDTKVLNTLYKDILGSDGNLTITKDDFSRLCIEETINSLYELPTAKVCWLVLKEEHILLRIEGNDYDLPVGYGQRVEVDVLTKNIEHFDVYHQKDKVLVLLKEKAKDPKSFMVQGLYEAKVKQKTRNVTKVK